MNKAAVRYGLGIYQHKDLIFLYFNSLSGKREFRVDTSTDGTLFTAADEKTELTGRDGSALKTGDCSDFRISGVGNKFYLVYRRETPTGRRTFGALSENLFSWREFSELTVTTGRDRAYPLTEPGMVVPGYTFSGKRVMYYGENVIHVAFSGDLAEWEADDVPVLSPRPGSFDNGPLTVAYAEITKRGINVIYYVRTYCAGENCYSLGSAVFDRRNPRKLLYRSEEPILEHVEGFQGKEIYPVGLTPRNDQLLSYWDITDEGIVVVSHPLKGHTGKTEGKKVKLVLEKLVQNPILKPIASHFWESKAVFNPAAVYDQGKVHLVYRAVGDNDVSVLGYASSRDGVTIDERLDTPCYVPRKDFEMNLSDTGNAYSNPFFSGGAYGGVEDPRITRLGDRYYMMYVAYDGRNPPRVAMSSIKVDDFRSHNFSAWSEPVLVSRPGVVDKNACILPEKIGDKYVIFHRIYPHILVDYVPDLDFDGKTRWLDGEFKIGPRPQMWDSRKLGVGAPPIKTDDGWLLIYQAVDDRDASRYKMGAMLLDYERPHIVRYRSRSPILEPDRWYENEGMKYGVAYPCGAVIKDNMLNVYYGGADTVVCAAQAPVDEFLTHLKRDEQASLYPVTVKPRV